MKARDIFESALMRGQKSSISENDSDTITSIEKGISEAELTKISVSTRCAEQIIRVLWEEIDELDRAVREKSGYIPGYIRAMFYALKTLDDISEQLDKKLDYCGGGSWVESIFEREFKNNLRKRNHLANAGKKEPESVDPELPQVIWRYEDEY